VTVLVVEADGGSRGNPGVAAYGTVVRDGESGAVLAERAAYLGEAVTNNVAEYSGLIAGLEAAAEIDPAARLDVRMDSKLVVSQMTGVWKIKNQALAELAGRAHQVLGSRTATFTWVPRADNQAADALANEAMDARGAIARGAGRVAAPSAEPVAVSRADAVRAAQRSASGCQRHIGVSAPVTTLVLVRHGVTADTDRDVFAGAAEPGPPLSAVGEAQAEAAAAELERMLAAPWFGLERPCELRASPTARTLGTAAPFSRTLGLEARPDPGFVEEEFGLWDGLTKDQVEERWPGGAASWSNDRTYVPPGGESRDEVGRRVKAAVDRTVAECRGGTVVVVTHAIATRAAIGAALGAPTDVWFSFRVAPASLNVLRFWDLGHTEVVCTNRTAA
jgi:probable phosphoglycerate mutase